MTYASLVEQTIRIDRLLEEAFVGMGGVNHQVLSDVVYDAVKDRIIRLELAPGEHVSIEALAVELGVSSTPLREALNRLVAQQLVRFEPYKGFRVAPLLTYEELAQLQEVRALLERHAVQTACKELTETSLASLALEVADMDAILERKPLDVGAFNGADRRFHSRLILAAGNPVLTRAYQDLNVHVQIARLFQRRGLEQGRQANAEHRRILEALREKKGREAATQAVAHIYGVVGRLRAIMDEPAASESRDAVDSGSREAE